MRFSQYFNEWLYGKDGYYSSYKSIGKDGDFYTAVSTSKFFGGSIGKRIVDVIQSGYLHENSTILEIGAHHGYLMADMIEFIYTLKPELLSTLKFAIVERFEHLRIKQKEYLKECFGDAIKFVHYNDISEVKEENAFVVANEIFDAFACELVYTKDNELQRAEVNDHKIEFVKNDSEYLEKICKKYNIKKGEIGIGYEEFAASLCNNIGKFEFITFDYGDKYPRNDFSARIYHKHNVHPIFEDNINLKDLYANSDITYDVNFAHLIDSFKNAGAENLAYETQVKALVNFGIIELLEMVKEHASQNEYLREVQKAKTLLEPTGMGDRFKMASFRKE